MKKIGLLYICTGQYKVFWNEFYKTAEEKFLLEYDKHYYIFTDDISYFQISDHIHVNKIDNLPWPLITLFRFRYFLSIRNELEQMDYLMFSNSNLVFVKEIKPDDILPRDEKNEKLFVTTHPGYELMSIWNAPFERNKKSTAYVPYNLGKKYVIGALNGGKTDAFLKMAETLNNNITIDLKKNYIARWHDESHLNCYIIKEENYRLLPPSYCYPYGQKVDYEKIIDTVGKDKYFDVKNFKGAALRSDKYPKLVVTIVRKSKACGRFLHRLFDRLMDKKI
jgi:hypothetical protein